LSIAAPTDRSAASANEWDREWRLHPQVALRDESFGALAYHYGTRRLHFLKSRTLVTLVSSLDQYDSAAAAIAALVPETERARYSRALARLAESGVIHAD
jgi:putative mycofactocin binding protein MftB